MQKKRRCQHLMRVTTIEPPMDIDEGADLLDALGHSVRLAMLEILRKEKRMTLADLRTAVADKFEPLTGGNAQFHVTKMARGGIVKVEREGGRDVVTLVRDVKVRVVKP